MSRPVSKLLPTTVVGSYPQPDWLINRDYLATRVPRVPTPGIWRVADDLLGQAQDDATLLAIRDMERAVIDIISDGEARRESYSSYFANALEGIDADRPAPLRNRRGAEVLVPRVVGPIRRTRPITVRDLEFLLANTDRVAKVTLPGPFTMAQQAVDEHYGDIEAMAMDFAAAVNEEALDLQAAGAAVIQLDEPWVRNDPEAAGRFAVKAVNRALAGIEVTTALHLCFGYAAVANAPKPAGYSFLPELADSIANQISIEAAQPKIDLGVLRELSNKTIILGMLDLADPEIETPERVAERIRAGLEYVSADRLIPAPDCGMKYLSREVAFGKLRALSRGAEIVRRRLA